MRFQPPLFSVAAALALLLTGCVASKIALFDEAQAVTPMPAGRYDELVNNGAWCVAKPGELYAVYLPNEGKVTVRLQPGNYEGEWFSAFTGERVALPPVKGPDWTSPKSPGWLDWALLLKKKQ